MLAFATTLGIAACNDAGKKEPTTTTDGTATDTSGAKKEVDMHNAENSLDLDGVYEGTLPCADCEGIKTTVNLNKDKTFTLSEEYLGKKDPMKFSSKGKWVVNQNTITLQFDKELQDRRVQYKAGEGRIWLLDQEGKEITGALADKYMLTKK